MYVQDYGLWFYAHQIKKDSKGRTLVGGAWKAPILKYSGSFIASNYLVVATNDMEDLVKACKINDWGFVSIVENGEGISFLVEHVKEISHAKIIQYLNSEKMISSCTKLAKQLENSIINTFGFPTVDGLPEDEESVLRSLYYKKFGIDLP